MLVREPEVISSGNAVPLVTGGGRLPWQPDGIKFTRPVNGQKSAFSPMQEKLRVGSKNDSHLFWWPRWDLSAYKVWGDQTTRAGCRNRNWCFLCHSWSACACGTRIYKPSPATERQITCIGTLMICKYSSEMAEYAVADVVMAAATFRDFRRLGAGRTTNCYQSIGLPMSACRPMCVK